MNFRIWVSLIFSLLVIGQESQETKRIERKEGGASVLIEYPEFVNANEVQKSINQGIQSALLRSFGFETGSGSIEERLQAFLDERTASGEQGAPLDINTKVEILFQSGNILSLKLQSGSGDAPNIVYENIDLSTGQKLSLNDVFKMELETELNKLGAAQWTASNPGSELENFKLSSNFAFDRRGFTFHFEPGQAKKSEITLTLDSVEKYLREKFVKNLE